MSSIPAAKRISAGSKTALKGHLTRTFKEINSAVASVSDDAGAKIISNHLASLEVKWLNYSQSVFDYIDCGTSLSPAEEEDEIQQYNGQQEKMVEIKVLGEQKVAELTGAS